MANSSILELQIQSFNSTLSRVFWFLLISFSLLALVVLGVIANVKVCSVLVRGRRFKKHLSNFMLFHLSITDLIYRLIVIPGYLAAKYFPVKTRSELSCKVAYTCLRAVYTAVFTSLVVIAFDRYQSITKPFKRLRRKPKLFLWIFVVWGYSTVCALPQFFNDGIGTLTINLTHFSNSTSYVFQICVATKESSSKRILIIFYFILGFLVPLVLITIAYIKIALFLWRKSRNRVLNQAAVNSRRRALQMLVLMVLGFLICLGPSQLKKLMESLGVIQDNAAVATTVFIFQLSSSLINPILYSHYSSEFKQGLKNGK
ncbi:neuromedin-U receptor 2-like [Stylophora pistillata]|uniref:neuromedin-U receptor 2-like n=1 Tax=Stylophora pistillata TaxID=50429 RepID=UPI000C053CFE|nr:neuromedin-U receptor 2-like [Stylophora pistillata]